MLRDTLSVSAGQGDGRGGRPTDVRSTDMREEVVGGVELLEALLPVADVVLVLLALHHGAGGVTSCSLRRNFEREWICSARKKPRVSHSFIRCPGVRGDLLAGRRAASSREPSPLALTRTGRPLPSYRVTKRVACVPPRARAVDRVFSVRSRRRPRSPVLATQHPRAPIRRLCTAPVRLPPRPGHTHNLF